MNKKKIINVLAAAFITTGLIVGGHAAIECHNTDHLTEYCELNKVFGTKHQINKINHDYIVYGIQAYKIEDNIATLKSSYRTETREDGTKINYSPVGFYYDNGELKKDIYIPFGGEIAITLGTPIFPEGTKAGDIIPIKDISIWDPKLINIIDDPEKKIKEIDDSIMHTF